MGAFYLRHTAQNSVRRAVSSSGFIDMGGLNLLERCPEQDVILGVLRESFVTTSANAGIPAVTVE